MELYCKYSLYWKSLMPFCQKLMAVPHPILFEKGSRCHYVVTRWNKLMDIKARAVNQQRFDYAMPTIRSQHQDPDRWYGHLWAKNEAKKRKEFYDRPFLYDPSQPEDLETQKRQHRETREEMDKVDAALLEQIDERSRKRSSDRSEEDWDREEAEFVRDWISTENFRRDCLMNHLRTFHHFPFSPSYRLELKCLTRRYLSWRKDRPRRDQSFRKIMEWKQEHRLWWRQEKAENDRYREFLRLNQKVYGEKDYHAIRMAYDKLKDQAEQKGVSMEPHFQALRDAAARLTPQSACN